MVLICVCIVSVRDVNIYVTQEDNIFVSVYGFINRFLSAPKKRSDH